MHYAVIIILEKNFPVKGYPQRILVHETRCIFEYIFWTKNYDANKLGQLIDISKDNNFQ